MDMFDFAGLLFGGNRNRIEATTVTATGAAASDGGVAGVTLDADVTPAEDVGEDADQTIIDLPTFPDVDEGDELIVTLVGDGPLKTPIVTANPGAGDRMRALANSAKTIADAAQAVAEAINQHFWHDTNGAHVTEATQEEWEQSHSGPNSLWNSLGMLFRDGLNNLLTLTTENGARALTIWDGLGNAAGNVVARFGTTIRLGSDEYPMLDISDGTIYFYPTADDVQSLYFGSTTRIQRLLNGSLKLQSDNGAVSLYGQTIGVTPANGSNTFSTAPGTVLWSSGGWAMAADQTATLAYNVSTCPTGIVLHWQPYTSGTVRDYFHHWQFIPKEQVASYAGATVDVTLSSSKFASVATKTLYVSDNRVTGHADNTATGTANGITYANNQWVLTQIIAV